MHFGERPTAAIAECWYWIRKLQARFLAGDYAPRLAAAAKAQRLLWTDAGHFRSGGISFLRRAGSRPRSATSASADEQPAHHRGSARAPPAARGVGRELPGEFREPRRAGRRRDRAHRRPRARRRAPLRTGHPARRARMASSTTRRSPMNALPRFYAARGFEPDRRCSICGTPATAICAGEPTARCGSSTRSIRTCGTTSPRPAPTSTIEAPVEHLDLATVIKVSQAVSGEIVLGKLIDTLMRTALEQAGAERGLLIFSRGAEPRIAAEASDQRQRDRGAAARRARGRGRAAGIGPALCRAHQRERDPRRRRGPRTFAADPYIRQRQARSILCLPLLNQARLIGVLYLENNLAPRVFAPARHRGAEAARLAGGDLAGEHPPVPRSRGTRGQDPAPRRRQHHRHLHLAISDGPHPRGQ